MYRNWHRIRGDRHVPLGRRRSVLQQETDRQMWERLILCQIAQPRTRKSKNYRHNWSYWWKNVVFGCLLIGFCGHSHPCPRKNRVTAATRYEMYNCNCRIKKVKWNLQGRWHAVYAKSVMIGSNRGGNQEVLIFRDRRLERAGVSLKWQIDRDRQLATVEMLTNRVS